MGRKKYTPKEALRKIRKYIDSQEDMLEEIKKTCGEGCADLILVDYETIKKVIKETKGV